MEIVSNVAVSLGSLLLYSLGSLPGMKYYILALVQIGLSLGYLLLVIGIPETPLWVLWKKKDKEETIAILRSLYGCYKNEDAINSQYCVVKSSVVDISIAFYEKIKLISCNSHVLIPFILLMFLSVFQQLCGGQSVVPSYAGLIFKQAGAPNPNAASTYSVGGVSLVVATALIGLLIEKVRRRFLLSISVVGMLASTTAIGTSNYIISSFFKCPSYNETTGGSEYDSSCKYLFPFTAVAIAVFTLSYGIGIGPVPDLLFTEYMPVSARGLTRAAANSLNGIAGMMIVGIFPSYANISLNYLAWWSLALINLFGLVFIMLFVKETKDKTDEEIHNSFCFGTGYSCNCCKVHKT